VESDLLLEVIDDLQHDLGKHLVLPLAMLPADATPAQVGAAARTALLRTRRGPGGDRSARAIWTTLRAELSGAEHLPGWTPMVDVIERALSWADRLDGPIDRARLTTDLRAVKGAIRVLADQVEMETVHA